MARSLMNEVWVSTPKGTVTKATRVTMWNSMIVTTISTARITKAIRMPMAAISAMATTSMCAKNSIGPGEIFFTYCISPEITLIPAMTICDGEVVKVVTVIAPPPAFRPKAANPLTTVFGQGRPLRDQPGKEADQKDFAHQRGEHVLVFVDRPKKGRDHDADHHERPKGRRHVALDQPEARIDLGAKLVEEVVEDGGIGSGHGADPGSQLAGRRNAGTRAWHVVEVLGVDVGLGGRLGVDAVGVSRHPAGFVLAAS